jgi:hypothetical protein
MGSLYCALAVYSVQWIVRHDFHRPFIGQRTVLYLPSCGSQLMEDDQSGAGWCYIGPNYFWERIFFTYGIHRPLDVSYGVAFLFLDMATLTVLYSILFFFLRAQTRRLLRAHTTTEEQTCDDATMGSQHNQQWEVRLGSADGDAEAPATRPSGPVIVTKSVAIYTEASRPNRPPANTQRTYNRINKVSVTLLIYPAIYMLLTIPISISRIAQFAGKDWGVSFIFFGACLFDCTGFMNVLLYTITRKGLVTWDMLKFWKRKKTELRPPSRRNGRWSTRGSPASEMDVSGEPVQLGRMNSKHPSTTSFVGLKEDAAKVGGTESDGDSHLES